MAGNILESASKHCWQISFLEEVSGSNFTVRLTDTVGGGGKGKKKFLCVIKVPLYGDFLMSFTKLNSENAEQALLAGSRVSLLEIFLELTFFKKKSEI